VASRPGPLVLSLLDGLWAVCRLHSESALPAWAEGGSFFSATRTPEELSVVCEEAAVPDGVKAEKGWAALKLHGPVPFEASGILSSLTAPLAEAGIPVFALSTFATDYLFVKTDRFPEAAAAWRRAGVEVRGKADPSTSPRST
jgi:hypothetical protein